MYYFKCLFAGKLTAAFGRLIYCQGWGPSMIGKESVRAILREVLADRAYESIKEAILSAELLAGRVLSIEDLANTLGI